MKTQTSETLEDNINTAGKWFSESTAAMAEIYNRQFKLGYDMFSNYLNADVNNGKSNLGFNPDLFRSGMELLRTNIENISRLSEKSMSILMSSYAGRATAADGKQKIAEAIRNAYNTQSKLIMGINQRFFEIFSESFKTANGDMEKSHAAFRKKTEDNIHMAEEAINSAMKTYSSIANKSIKDKEEMLTAINKQVEFLTQSSLKLWSDLLQTTEIENNKPGGKEKEKRKANQSKK